MRTAMFGKTNVELHEGDELKEYDIMNYAGNPKLDGLFDRVIVSLDLSRLPMSRVMPFLNNVFEMLVPMGELTVYTPCAEFAAKQIFTNSPDALTFLSLYGGDEQPYRACYSLLNLRNLLERAGFVARLANVGVINVNMTTGEQMQMPVNVVIAAKVDNDKRTISES